MDSRDKEEVFYWDKHDDCIYLSKNAAKRLNRDASVRYNICCGYEENTDIMLRPTHKIYNLYHYCSINTMMNIISNNCLWLTNCQTSNDSEEILWAIKKFKELAISICDNKFDEIRNKETFSSVIDIIIQRMKSAVKSEVLFKLQAKKNEMMDMSDEERVESYRKNALYILRTVLNKIKNNMSQIYVSCLSKSKDSLSQWRGYGDDGYGVAIGFNVDKLDSLSQAGIELRQILYFDNMQNPKLMDGLNQYALEQIRADWFYYNILPVMKPQGFSEEEESRLVVIPRKSKMKVGYYFKGDKLHDYYKLPLPNDCISEIVLGPKCKITKKDLVTFFGSCGININEDQIIPSALSYR